jgi:hypothetical protein
MQPQPRRERPQSLSEAARPTLASTSRTIATTTGGSRPSQVPAGEAGGIVGTALAEGSAVATGRLAVADVVALGLTAGEAVPSAGGDGWTGGDAAGFPVLGSTVV